MALPRPGASARFFISLAIVVLALVGTVLVGLRGLADVHAVNRQVFSDNLLTVERTSRLITHLGQAEVVSLEIASAPAAPAADRARARLEEIIVPAVRDEIASLEAIHAHDPPAEEAQIDRVSALWTVYMTTARPGLLRNDRHRPATTAAVARTLDPLIALVSGRAPREVADAGVAHAAATQIYRRSRIWMLVAATLALIAAATMIRAGLTLRRLLLSQMHDRGYAESSSEYTGRLQATEDEGEAHELLRRQLERTHPGAHAVVLSRNNSDDRLEPRTMLGELPELKPALEHAGPRACLAIRFATGHSQGDGEPLMSCEICGRLAGVSSCEPLVVGGEVIGSVLVSQPVATGTADALRIRETVAQAAPVLGNLRNLALAQLRAATDTLTGLPNQRSVQDTLKRMVAQASRTITPLSAVLVDLDHFKQVNDVYGHDRGDEVLAAVGVAFRNVVREADFVGRYGGEEFLILLPGTDKPGAVQVAEAVRAAIAAIRVAGIDRPITASCGVAVLPDDAGDGVTLFRATDRALYVAKSEGRNRVHAADGAARSPTSPPGSARPRGARVHEGMPGLQALAEPEVLREGGPHG
ncbi:MAG TPA: GGDEF domain-containing protein [Solirubrobacteraceae bacterium]|jgi:diguanylate cyclase (GGDEF)-like protein|nr:GGDEF domain-containing protein [Solirubrobacteraceae bacterium]